MTRWISVTPDGVMHEHDDEPTLARLQLAAEGYVEVTPSPDPGLTVSVFLNEERRDREGNGLLLNPKASVFMEPLLWPGQRIVGTLIVAGKADDDGNLSDLAEEEVSRLREVFA